VKDQLLLFIMNLLPALLNLVTVSEEMINSPAQFIIAATRDLTDS